MAIDPNEIQLTADQRQLIAELADRLGCSPQDALSDLIATARGRRRSRRNAPGTSSESAHELGKRLGLFASLKDGPKDLSSNPRYMEGFGQRADRSSTH